MRSVAELARQLKVVERVRDLDTALAESVARQGDPHIAVIPEGPYVVPIHGGA